LREQLKQLRIGCFSGPSQKIQTDYRLRNCPVATFHPKFLRKARARSSHCCCLLPREHLYRLGSLLALDIAALSHASYYLASPSFLMRFRGSGVEESRDCSKYAEVE
jgi:hypothetical protein